MTHFHPYARPGQQQSCSAPTLKARISQYNALADALGGNPPPLLHSKTRQSKVYPPPAQSIPVPTCDIKTLPVPQHLPTTRSTSPAPHRPPPSAQGEVCPAVLTPTPRPASPSTEDTGRPLIGEPIVSLPIPDSTHPGIPTRAIDRPPAARPGRAERAGEAISVPIEKIQRGRARARAIIQGAQDSARPRRRAPRVLPPPVDAPKLRLRCPLPPGVSTFGDPITVGGAVGLHCRQCPGIGRVVVNKWIQENVDGVGERLDGVFDSAKLYVHRGLFACDPEAHFVFNSPTMKTPQEGFQRAHLLTMMVDKQYKAWHSSRFLDADHARDLQDLVGADVVPTRGTRVTWDMIYLVAVRRWKDRYGVYHYFPEVEIRI